MITVWYKLPGMARCFSFLVVQVRRCRSNADIDIYVRSYYTVGIVRLYCNYVVVGYEYVVIELSRWSDGDVIMSARR